MAVQDSDADWRSAGGWPIFIYVEDDGTERYVVAKPTERPSTPLARAFPSRRASRCDTGAQPNAGNFLGAAIGGFAGSRLGTFGAAAGAGIGAWLGERLRRSRRRNPPEQKMTRLQLWWESVSLLDPSIGRRSRSSSSASKRAPHQDLRIGHAPNKEEVADIFLSVGTIYGASTSST